MNNSFARLIDGMCTTLRTEVLSRLDDEFARGQVYGVINLLNTFKSRADWSTDFLSRQVAAQYEALHAVHALLQNTADAPPVAVRQTPVPITVADLLERRDEANRDIGQLLQWLEQSRAVLPAEQAAAIEAQLRLAMRREIEIELKSSPRPLFAAMSSGRED